MVDKITTEQLDAYYSRFTCPVCLKNCTSYADQLPWFGTTWYVLRYICEFCGLIHFHKP